MKNSIQGSIHKMRQNKQNNIAFIAFLIGASFLIVCTFFETEYTCIYRNEKGRLEGKVYDSYFDPFRGINARACIKVETALYEEHKDTKGCLNTFNKFNNVIMTCDTLNGHTLLESLEKVLKMAEAGMLQSSKTFIFKHDHDHIKLDIKHRSKQIKQMFDVPITFITGNFNISDISEAYDWEGLGIKFRECNNDSYCLRMCIFNSSNRFTPQEMKDFNVDNTILGYSQDNPREVCSKVKKYRCDIYSDPNADYITHEFGHYRGAKHARFGIMRAEQGNVNVDRFLTMNNYEQIHELMYLSKELDCLKVNRNTV